MKSDDVLVADSAWRLIFELVLPEGTVLKRLRLVGDESLRHLVRVISVPPERDLDCMIMLNAGSNSWWHDKKGLLETYEIYSLPAGREDFTQWYRFDCTKCKY